MPFEIIKMGDIGMKNLLMAVCITCVCFLIACDAQDNANASPVPSPLVFSEESRFDPQLFTEPLSPEQPVIDYIERVAAKQNDSHIESNWYELIQGKSLLTKESKENSNVQDPGDFGILSYEEYELKQRLNSQEKLMQWLDNSPKQFISEQNVKDLISLTSDQSRTNTEKKFWKSFHRTNRILLYNS